MELLRRPDTPGLGVSYFSIIPYNKQYGWAVFVYSGTEGYGTSHYYHSVTFIP